MPVHVLMSRPVLACDWRVTLWVLIGANYQSVMVSGLGSLYCECWCYTLALKLLASCKLRLVYNTITGHGSVHKQSSRQQENEIDIRAIFSYLWNYRQIQHGDRQKSNE